MNNNNNLTVLLSVMLVFFSYSLASNAQVTIGSCESPVSGALLQIKESETPNGVNATRGLAMPRVKLTNQTALYPMFETTAGSGIANTDYNNAIKKANEDAKHTGLIVYHTDQCIFEGAGLYVWGVASGIKLVTSLTCRLEFKY